MANVFSKLKKWLKGTNSKYQTSTATSKKYYQKVATNSSSKSDISKALKEQKKKEAEKKKQLTNAFKAKENAVTKTQDSKPSVNSNGTDRVLKKIQEKTVRLPEVKTRENELMRAKKIATGLSTKDVQFQQKLGLNPTLTATDITYGNAKAPIATAALGANKGIANGSTLGFQHLAYNNANPIIKNAIDDVQSNYTRAQKAAGTVGEFVGMATPYIMTSGIGAKIGSNIIGKAGTSTEGVAKAIEGSRFMQGLGAKTGKDIAKISSKIAKELTKDLGLHLTTESVQSMIASLDNNSGNQDATLNDYVGEYVRQQAINTLFNLGLDLTPLLGKAAKQIGEAGALKLADQTGAVGDDISKLAKENIEDVGYHAGDLGKSEWLGVQSGGRGTGHFGTGTYFVGNKEKIKYHNSRKGVEAPKHKVDFSKYNLYKAKDYKDGKDLHEALKQINETDKLSDRQSINYSKDELSDMFYDAREDADIDSAEKLAKFINEHFYNREFVVKDDYPDTFDVNAWYKDNGLAYDQIEAQLEKEGFDKYSNIDDEILGLLEPRHQTPRQNRFDEIYNERLSKAPAKPDKITIKKLGNEITADDLIADERGIIDDEVIKQYDKIKDKSDTYNNAIEVLSKKLGKTKEELNSILRDIESAYDAEKASGNDMLKTDSMSTRLMKALGYDGVDVRGIEDLDNTMYGSVIYDVKPESVIKESPSITPKAKSKTKAEPPKTKEFAKVDDAMSGVKDSDNIKTDVETKAEQPKLETIDSPMEDSKFSKKTQAARDQAEKNATGEIREDSNKRNTTRKEYEVKMEEYEASLDDGTKKHIQRHAVQIYGDSKNDTVRAIIDEKFKNGDYIIEAQNDKEMAAEAANWWYENLDDNAKEIKNIANRNHSKLFEKIDDISKLEWKVSIGYDIAQKNIDVDPEFFGSMLDDCVKVANDLGTEWGRTGRVQQMIARSTPSGAKKVTENTIKNGLSKNAHYIKKYGNIKEFRKLRKTNTEEYYKYIDNMYEKFKADSNNKDFVEAVEDIASNPKASTDEIFEKTMKAGDIAFSKQKRNGADVVTTARYVAMLSSPKTHVRNITGNVVRGTMGGVSDVLEQGLLSSQIKNGKISKEDILFRKKVSLDCVTESHLKNPKTENGKWAKELYDRNEADLFGKPSIETRIGDNTTAADAKLKDSLRKVWNKEDNSATKLIDSASEIEKWALTKEDKMSLMARYRSCAQKLKASIGDSYNKLSNSEKREIDHLIHQRAKIYAQDATYRLPNEWANYISKLSKKATDASASGIERTLGRVVNIMMPFAQTPANIVKTIFDFSPAGIVKGSSETKNILKQFDNAMSKAVTAEEKRNARIAFTMAINDAVEKKAKGITGTSLMLIGALAGALETDEFHFTTNIGNDEESKVKKDWGEQDYSVVFTTPNGNQYSVTLDWLSPTATDLFVGVSFGQMFNDVFIEKDFNFSSLPAAVLSATSKLIEPTMDTTMFQSIKSTLETVQKMNSYADESEKIDPITAVVFQTMINYAGQLSPSVVQQITRACSNSDFLITAKNNTNYQLASLLAKTPLAGLAFGGKTNAWGELKNERDNDKAWALETLIRFGKFGVLPANVNKITADKTDRELLALAKKTDDWDIMPSVEYNNNITIGRNPDDQKKLTLKSKDLSLYNQAKTTSGEDCMKTALESVIFNRYEKQGTKKVFVEGYTEEEKQELINWSKGKSAKQVIAKLLNDEYYKKASDTEKAKMISSVLNSSSDEAKGTKRASELAVAKKNGMSEDSYNFRNELTEKQQKDANEYIKSGLLTEEDFVKFSRKAGKTYYYEDENGGYSKVGFTKESMTNALNSKEFDYLTDEQKAGLFNTYKTPTAKSYNESSSGRRYGRRYSSSSSRKIPVSSANKSAYKASKPSIKMATTTSKGTSSLAQALENMNKAGAKITPPKNKE